MVSRSCFAALDDANRCEAIRQLGNIPCAAYGSLQSTRSQNGLLPGFKCFLCEGSPQPPSAILGEARCRKISTEAIETFSKLVESPAFLDSRRPRVLAMVVLKQFAVHFTDPSFLDFEQSTLAQWCLKSLRSSIRELRIAARYVVPRIMGIVLINAMS
jgi:serine/threonine-protein kinase ATR